MSAKLGEMLLKVGALTPQELEQVLNAQAIYGGRLGTNLVEMGLVEEDQLARVLSEQLGVPCIVHGAVDAIPESVLTLIPQELVAKYRVLPLALEGKRLIMAIADPSDFKALDEIGFITGLVVVPRLCPELRLSIALERFYGVKRPMRYIPVEGGARSRYAPADVRHAVLEEPSQSWGMAGEASDIPERLSMPDLAERLSMATGEKDVVRALLTYLGGEFDRGAVIRVKSGNLFGIGAVSGGREMEGFSGYACPLEGCPQLRRVVQEKSPFVGEIGGADSALVKAMGEEPPAPALLVPLSLGGEVAALICANDRHGRLGGGAFELQRVAVMAELSFEMLSCRRKITSA